MQIGAEIGTNTISVNCKNIYINDVFKINGAGGETKFPMQAPYLNCI